MSEIEKAIKERNEIINKVLIQIKKDVEVQDFTSIEELIKDLPIEKLIDYLPE